MSISNDNNIGRKIAFEQLIPFLIINFGVNLLIFGNPWHVTAATVTLILTTVALPIFYKRKLNSIATRVFLGEENLYFRLQGQDHTLKREEIAEVFDSGWNSGIQFLFIRKRNGEDIQFFPNKAYGEFHKGHLKKMIQTWISKS